MNIISIAPRAIFSAALALIIASCSCNSGTARERRLVSRRGADDATALINKAPSMSQMELEGFLLQVRANEYEYRTQGKPDVADAYIKAFEETLSTQGDSLYAAINAPAPSE